MLVWLNFMPRLSYEKKNMEYNTKIFQRMEKVIMFYEHMWNRIVVG